MARLKTVSGWAVRPVDTRTVSTPRKQVDPLYQTSDYRNWREQVIARAGFQCEAEQDGSRCNRREPEWRLYADHVHEVKDGGAEFDIGNGQCLCAKHHTLKTNVERQKRFSS